MSVSTTNADVGGEGVEAISCDYVGDAIELGYNANYVSDILGKFEDEEVVMELLNSVSAGVLYSPGIPKDRYLCLIMPLRLAD